MILGNKKKILPHEAADYFWALAEFNVVPIITWSFDGKVLTTNKAFLDLIGYSEEDFKKGKISWRDITPSEFLHLDETCIKELATQRIASVYEKQYVRKDGKRIKVRLYNASSDLGASRKGMAMIIGV